VYYYIYDSFLNAKKYRKILERIEVRLGVLGIPGKIKRLNILHHQKEAIEESMALQKDIKNIPFLTLTLDYTTLDHAKFLKALLFCKENLKMENGNLQSVPLNLK